MELKLASKKPNGEIFFFADGTSFDKFYEEHSEEEYPFIGAQPFTKGSPVFDSASPSERDFYNMLEERGINKNEFIDFINTEESEELDQKWDDEIEKMFENGILRELSDEEKEKIKKEEQQLSEIAWSKCPRCGGGDRGEGTVMNGVDQIIQVPSLLKRLGIEKHDHIIACHKCGAWYETSTGKSLMQNEMMECNKLWDESQEENK